jgi:hypothetical protein
LLRRFTLGHLRQLDKALRAVHQLAFELLGITAGESVTRDFDSTYVRSYIAAPGRGSDLDEALHPAPTAVLRRRARHLPAREAEEGQGGAVWVPKTRICL